MLPCDARGTSSLPCVIILFLCFFSVLFCFYTLLCQCIVPFIKSPLAILMSCHPRATCYIAECCHLANSITCYPRATCHVAGCCHLASSIIYHARATSHMAGCCSLPPGKFNVMSSQSKQSKAKQKMCRPNGRWHVCMPTLNCKRKISRATCHIAGCKNSICHLKIVFRRIFATNIDVSLKCRSGFVQLRWKYATIGQMAYEFLFVFHCKYGRELNIVLFEIN